MTATGKGPLEFRPMTGFMSLADKLAAVLGIDRSEWWGGEEGLRSVAETKLKEMGVPEKPITLTGTNATVTPRQMAEHAGFIQKRKRLKK